MMGNNSFTILPMSQRFYLEPGKVYTGKITVVNPVDATSDFAYKASISPYGVVGGDYTADLTTNYNRSIITNWIKILEPTGKVPPNGSKDIEFTITVPENAPSGGQYATIAVSSDSDQKSGDGVAVQSVFEMASIIYANVAGETVRSGEIIKNNVPGFSTMTPIMVGAVIENGGNIHEDATFIIKISDVFSGKVILPTEEDNGQYNEIIMPETTKQVTRNISNLPAIGVVKVSQTIYYNGKVSTVEKNVLICPIWFMVLMILTLASIVTAIVVTVKKHRKKKYYL